MSRALASFLNRINVPVSPMLVLAVIFVLSVIYAFAAEVSTWASGIAAQALYWWR